MYVCILHSNTAAIEELERNNAPTQFRRKMATCKRNLLNCGRMFRAYYSLSVKRCRSTQDRRTRQLDVALADNASRKLLHSSKLPQNTTQFQKKSHLRSRTTQTVKVRSGHHRHVRTRCVSVCVCCPLRTIPYVLCTSLDFQKAAFFKSDVALHGWRTVDANIIIARDSLLLRTFALKVETHVEYARNDVHVLYYS